MVRIVDKLKKEFANPSYDEVLIGGAESKYDHPDHLDDTPEVLKDIWGKSVTMCSCGEKHTLGKDVPLKLISSEGIADTAADFVVLDDFHKYIVSFECSDTDFHPVLSLYSSHSFSVS